MENTCIAILKSGSRKGQACGNKTKNHGQFCGRHKKKEEEIPTKLGRTKFQTLVYVLKFLYGMKGRKIPLHNKEKKIVAYTIVSHKDYGILSKYRWTLHKKYVKGYVKGQNPRMNRFVYIELMKNKIDSKTVIDHRNFNKLDNRRTNLRAVPASEDRNIPKKQGCSSHYHGVSWNKGQKLWRATIRTKDKQLSACYKKEDHAAHQYNLWVEQYNLNASKNNVLVPDDFIPWVSKNAGRELPKNICKQRNKYTVVWNIRYSRRSNNKKR
jgi:HNH endonuclease